MRTEIVNFTRLDTDLEHIMKHILKINVKSFHPILASLKAALGKTFKDFHVLRYERTFTYNDGGNVDKDLDGSPALKLMHSIAYARHKVIINDPNMDTLILWNDCKFNNWQLNDFNKWQVQYGSTFSVNPSTVSTTALQYKEEYTNWKRGKFNIQTGNAGNSILIPILSPMMNPNFLLGVILLKI